MAKQKMAKKKQQKQQQIAKTKQEPKKELIIAGMSSPANFGERIAQKLFKW